MILLLTLLWNALEAIYEGLYDNGKKTISGVIEFISKIVAAGSVAYITYGLTVGTIDIPLWKLIVGFFFVRFLIFDFVYNAIRKLPLLYVGRTKLYDKILSKVPGNFILFVKVILGIVGVAFLLGLK